MEWQDAVVIIIANLCVTVFFYLLVPITLVIKGKKYSEKQLKKIVIINCVVVWLIFCIISIANNTDSISGAVFLWGWVGYKILKKRCLITDQESFGVIKKKEMYPTAGQGKKHIGGQDGRMVSKMCISTKESEPYTPYKPNEFYGSDFVRKDNNSNVKCSSSVNSIQEPRFVQANMEATNDKMIKCIRCDNEISSMSKFCQYCGQKQATTKSAIRYCRECGNKLQDRYVFCNKCGTKVRDI